MSAVSRWSAVRPVEPSADPNPTAGQGWGRAPNERTILGGSMNPSAGTTWHPTVVNLLILVFLELAAYSILRYAFRQSLGG